MFMYTLCEIMLGVLWTVGFLRFLCCGLVMDI